MPSCASLASYDHGKLVAGLLARAFHEVARLDISAWCTHEPVPWAERRSGDERQLNPGDRWGGLFDCAWFRFTGSVPAAAAGKPLVALIDVNGELLVHDAAGTPLRGLTCVFSDFDRRQGLPGKRVMPLAEAAVAGTPIELWADAGCNDLFGRLPGGGAIVEARLAIFDAEMQALAYDVQVLANLAWAMTNHDGRKKRTLAALDAFAARIGMITSDDAQNAGKVGGGSGPAPTAITSVARERALLAPLLAEKGAPDRFQVHAIGHAHIDLAWLWPIRESRRKIGRTIATVLRNMEQYPDYHFAISQPQAVAWLREDYPALYAQFARRVAEGRIELVGGMWVESDCNVTSGESLARQLLHGQRAWQAWFGRRSTVAWLPDVFGFSAGLPQLLAQAGLTGFVSSKMLLNMHNKMPHNLFHWQGIDGSTVLVHLPPTGHYNDPATGDNVLTIQKEQRDVAISARGLLLFGIGDGGGGAGTDHFERLARIGDLDSLPLVRQGRSEDFFAAVRADAEQASEPLPVWRGDLYLERHQGTYTTQGRTKRLHRQLEWRLLQTEAACVRALRAGHAYPRVALDRIWKSTLLHQFHDILPGSSIRRVHAESEATCTALVAELDGLIAAADARLPAGNGAVVNDLAWTRTEWVRGAAGWRQVTVAPLAVAALPEAVAPIPALSATPRLLDNGLLRVRLADDGRLASVVDLRNGREVLAGPGNDLVLIDDAQDAWEIAYDYQRAPLERPRLVAERAGVDGPAAWIEQDRRIGNSTITQRLVLMAGSARLDVHTQLDWHERHRMLRVRFPTTVDPGFAHTETAFGSQLRPTHRNTSWDAARHEISGHSWVDLSERAYGVALLNDSKYGYRLDGGLLDLDLLRTPTYPDTETDQGAHAFSYALYPHLGDHVTGGVVAAAQALNCPLRVVPGRGALAALVAIDGELAISALKLAEDNDDVVLRVYEPHGATIAAQVRGLCDPQVVDLLEERPQPLMQGENGTAAFTVPPYGVRTLRGRLSA